MTSTLLRRLVVPLVATFFLLPAAVSFGQFGAARKAKDAKDAKEAKDDAAKDADAKDADSKDAKDKAEKKDGPGFGSARKGAKEKDSKDKDDESDSDDEKETIDPAKRKLMNLLNKKLGKKKDGFFVFWVSETMYSKPDPTAAGGAALPRTQSGFIETTTAEAKVLETKDTTLDFLVDYLSEYPPPDPRAARRRKKNDPIPTPLPLRSWSERVDWYPESAEAHAVQERLQETLDARLSGKAKK